jgi:hypothetical protein
MFSKIEGSSVVSTGQAYPLIGASMTPFEQSYLNFDNPKTREITLTKGYVSLVDAADFEFLSQWTWKAGVRKGMVYAYRCQWNRERQKVENISMSRFLLGLQYGDRREADHINRSTLDNRRSNLRIATRAQNNTNRILKVDKNSGYRGVRRVNKCSKWEARIGFDKKLIHLGCYDTAEEAYAVYCAAAKRYHGEFAVTP